MIPGLADAGGRTAIRELSEKRLPGTPTSDFRIQRREIQVAGDSAWELAWYEETYRGNDPVRMKGRYLIVWKRSSDGVWRVHRNLYNFSGTAPLGRACGFCERRTANGERRTIHLLPATPPTRVKCNTSVPQEGHDGC